MARLLITLIMLFVSLLIVESLQKIPFPVPMATCHDVEGIIQRRVTAWVKKDYTLAASLLRLHFHDCVLRGCDASILLNHAGSEKFAVASKTLRGYEVIDEIKAEIEQACPKRISCADILTAAARDATVILGSPFWDVRFGRKDGKISIAREADLIVPQGHENVTTLLKLFESLNLNILDLVVLSGSHTIGRSTCAAFQNRLNNFNGTRRADPSIDLHYLIALRKICTKSYIYANLDTTTPKIFDNEYYKNLQKKKGLLSTDQALHTDPRTMPFVEAMVSQPLVFSGQFIASMIKLGDVVKNKPSQGEIRMKCGFVN